MKQTVVKCNRCKKVNNGKYYHLEIHEYNAPISHVDFRFPIFTDGIAYHLPYKQEDVCYNCLHTEGEVF